MKIDQNKYIGEIKDTKPYVYSKMKKFREKYEKNEPFGIIQLQYDYKCNFKCQHCSINKVQHHYNKRSLTPKDVYDIARQADKLGLARFVITGGEPLFFKELDAIIEAIDPNQFYISVDSNGWFITEEKMKHLKALGVDRIQLSLDSLDSEEHDSFRRAKGSHKRVVAGIKHILDAGLQLFIATVVTKERLYSNEFHSFIKEMNLLNVGVFVTFAKPVGAWEENYTNMLTKEDIAYFKELEKNHHVFSHLTPAYGIEQGCPAIVNQFTIDKFGDVLPCPYIYISLGNIFEEPLEDILINALKIKELKSDTCRMATDLDFHKKYIEPFVNGKKELAKAKDVFGSLK
jgi:MoaA/NifB/PqqE/SkfB family radical SAM enzyme